MNNDPSLKQAEAELGQVQLKLGLDLLQFIYIKLSRLTATCHWAEVAKINITTSVPPAPVTQATTSHSKTTLAPIHYPQTYLQVT